MAEAFLGVNMAVEDTFNRRVDGAEGANHCLKDPRRLAKKVGKPVGQNPSRTPLTDLSDQLSHSTR